MTTDANLSFGESLRVSDTISLVIEIVSLRWREGKFRTPGLCEQDIRLGCAKGCLFPLKGLSVV